MEFTEEIFMGSAVSVGRGFLREKERLHMNLAKIPKKGGVLKPPFFFDVLGIAAAFMTSKYKIIFF